MFYNKIIYFIFFPLLISCSVNTVYIQSDPQGASIYKSDNSEGVWERFPNSSIITPFEIEVFTEENYFIKAKKYGYLDSEKTSIKQLFSDKNYRLKLIKINKNTVYDEFYEKSLIHYELDELKKINVSITNFTINQEIKKETSSTVIEILQDCLIKTGVFNIVDRKNISQILNEISFQQTGITDTIKAAEIGKISNIQEIITGEIGRINNAFLLTVKFTDLSTGRISYSDNCKFSDENEMKEIIVDLVNKIVKKRFLNNQ